MDTSGNFSLHQVALEALARGEAEGTIHRSVCLPGDAKSFIFFVLDFYKSFGYKHQSHLSHFFF